MAFAIHPLMSTYPGASFTPNGNLNGPHLAMRSGGDALGYWAHVPWEIPEPPVWDLPPAIKAAIEGRGTGVYGLPLQGPGMPFNYGWPKYGPVSDLLWPRLRRIWMETWRAKRDRGAEKARTGADGRCHFDQSSAVMVGTNILLTLTYSRKAQSLRTKLSSRILQDRTLRRREREDRRRPICVCRAKVLLLNCLYACVSSSSSSFREVDHI